MRAEDVVVAGLPGPARVRTPDGGRSPRGALIALHGAAQPERDQPIFEHLAATVTPLGLAVLSYDRRPSTDGGDVPLEVQAADADVARAWLTAAYDVPVGLFGFSQGAWAACVVAADDPTVSSLVLLGFSGVSPAAQMRFHTDELLRRDGYDDQARAQLRVLRLAVENVLRGVGDRAVAAQLLADAAVEPWFEMAYLPPELPPEEVRWPDLDFDPAPLVAGVRCRTLLAHGRDEDTVPVAETRDLWAALGSRDLRTVDLDGCGHFPVPGTPAPDEVTVERISPDWTAALTTFFAEA